MRKLITIFTIVLFVSGIAGAGTADVMIVVDESGSMATEHAWIPSMVSALDAALVSAGVTGNQYALVGFAYNTTGITAPASTLPRKFTVGSGDWGTATELGNAAAGLQVYGGWEDGYEAMDFGLNATNYTWRAGAVSNIILITDEDRDDLSGQTYSGMLSNLSGTLLNAVVDNSFADGAGSTALGVDSGGTAYIADGSGGYTTSTGGTATASSTKTHYIDLAWATNGAGWDLNQLRAGGLTADSFTAAFVAIKVEEITEVIPAPGAILLGSIGVGLVGWLRRRRTL